MINHDNMRMVYPESMHFMLTSMSSTKHLVHYLHLFSQKWQHFVCSLSLFSLLAYNKGHNSNKAIFKYQGLPWLGSLRAAFRVRLLHLTDPGSSCQGSSALPKASWGCFALQWPPKTNRLQTPWCSLLWGKKWKNAKKKLMTFRRLSHLQELGILGDKTMNCMAHWHLASPGTFFAGLLCSPGLPQGTNKWSSNYQPSELVLYQSYWQHRLYSN